MRVLGAGEEEMEDGLFDPGTAVGAVGRWHAFDSEQGFVQRNVARPELCE